jgi:geranylgeranyl diphosphate synthase type II
MHSFSQLVMRFEERFTKELPFPSQPEDLYEPCRYFLSIGGKRIRPVLCLMGNELFADIHEDAFYAAKALELFHNFTLIHDDIMDKAPLRRGKQTIHQRNGLTAGILCGDVMNIFAYDELAKVNTCLPQLLRVFNKTAAEVCEGQQLDMDFECRENVSIEEYIYMIMLKTSVLLACALKMGALIGGSTEGNADKLYNFGKNLGFAFQLQDDYLDAFGTSDKVGKQTGGDILANKKTFLLLKALENGTLVQKEKIIELLSSNTEKKVEKMRQLYCETYADIACRDAVKQYSDLAFQSLDDVAVLSKRKEQLRNLALFLLQREH